MKEKPGIEINTMKPIKIGKGARIVSATETHRVTNKVTLRKANKMAKRARNLSKVKSRARPASCKRLL